MKEKLKTALIIILLILSTCLILIGCKTNRFRFILPGYSIRSTSVIHYRDNCDLNRFTEQFREADSLFYEKYELPLTR
ncbi:MAG: hypothetical protein AAGU18_10960 [Proteiniphilum sp.]